VLKLVKNPNFEKNQFNIEEVKKFLIFKVFPFLAFDFDRPSESVLHGHSSIFFHYLSFFNLYMYQEVVVK
jgi:hypothetical protein